MSLYMDSSLRSSLREVIEWERKNPAIALRDSLVEQNRKKKIQTDLAKLASTPIVRTARASNKFTSHTEFCPHCKAPFWKKHHSARYCSSSCQVAAGRIAEREKATPNEWRTPRTCPSCSCEFIPHHSCAKTCSDTCHKKRLAENARALYEARNARRREARQKDKVAS
jgi:hypothetical protein